MKIMGLLIFILFSFIPNFSLAEKNCHGNFINPLTDICWDCLFPITIGSTSITKASNRPDRGNPTSPLCACGTPVPRLGVAAGFFEPVFLADVTKQPFCFVNLGGMIIKPGIKIARTYKYKKNYAGASSWHVHWYNYPVLFLLNLFNDFACLENSNYYLAYMSELDPMWEDDELTFLLNPESILFSNLIAQAACAADCVAASAYLPIDQLFWCAGCQGSMYPLNGHVQEQVGSVQASLLIAERINYKFHRLGLALGTSGEEALCSPYIMPIMKKSQYRSQIVNPSPGTGRYACNPYGRSSAFYEAFKEVPITGEDFGWLIWRKRNCCVL